MSLQQKIPLLPQACRVRRWHGGAPPLHWAPRGRIQPPTYYVPAVDADDAIRVEKAFGHRDIRDVGAHHLAWVAYRHPVQQVRVDVFRPAEPG